MLKTTISVLLLITAVTNDTFAVNDVTIGTSPTADITDWSDEYCVQDADPADCNDYSGQSDGKGACIASNYSAPGPADTAFLRYDFDDTGATGRNTIDGCWLVDVDQNGFSNRALCFSVSSSGGTAVRVTSQLFTCNDTTPGCSGSAPIATSSAVCAINNAVPDVNQLTDCAIADTDLAVECSASLSDMGWTSGRIGLLQGCSSVSATPTSTFKDCFGDPSAPLFIDPTNGENLPVDLQFFEIE